LSLGKLVGADVILPLSGNVRDLSPLVAIKPEEGREPDPDSWWDVDEFVPSAEICQGLPATVLMGSGGERLDAQVSHAVSSELVPLLPNPAWRTSVFVISLPQRVSELYGGAPVVLMDEPDRLAGVMLCSASTEADVFAVWCYAIRGSL
jgi:hypothetical protein